MKKKTKQNVFKIVCELNNVNVSDFCMKNVKTNFKIKYCIIKLIIVINSTISKSLVYQAHKSPYYIRPSIIDYRTFIN